MFPIFLYCTSRHYQKVFYNCFCFYVMEYRNCTSESLLCFTQKNNFCIINKIKLAVVLYSLLKLLNLLMSIILSIPWFCLWFKTSSVGVSVISKFYNSIETFLWLFIYYCVSWESSHHIFFFQLTQNPFLLINYLDCFRFHDKHHESLFDNLLISWTLLATDTLKDFSEFIQDKHTFEPVQ